MQKSHTRTRLLDLNDLAPHPAQRIFAATTEAELRALADDIGRRGQQQPIEVIPDGQSGYWIVCGCRRVEAAKLSGETSIKAIVRYDLAEAGPLAVEEHLIRDNFDRRQLSDFDRACCALRLKEISAEQKRGRKLTKSQANHVRQSTRDWIGESLGIGGRQVSRLLRVFDTPQEVQDAFRAGALTLVEVNQVACLPPAKMQEIAMAIARGASPKEALTSHVTDLVDPAQRVRTQYRGLLRQLDKAAAASSNGVDALTLMDVTLASDRIILQRGAELIVALVDRLDDLEQEIQEWDDDHGTSCPTMT